jgi:enamine deaminase RidA (YjgF/YER057c/UK114 family)
MTETTVAPVDKLIRVYLKMRDRCKELEAQKEEIEEQMVLVKGKLLEACNAVGAHSLNTPFGRLTRTLKTRYWTSDWESMHKFVIENNAVSLLERRISQAVMKKFLLDHPELMPPGLNADSEYDVTVYRK